MSNQPYLPNSNGDYYATDVYAVSGTDYSITFPYLSQSLLDDGETSPYIKVFHIADSGTVSTVSFTMPTPYMVRLASVPSSGSIVIRRDSSINGRSVSYAAGATLSQATLEIDSLQAFYLYQEVADRIVNAFETNEDNAKFDARFSIEGDGSETDFRLENATYTIDQDISKIAVWCFIGGAFVSSVDYTLSQDSDGVVVVSFGRALEDGEKGEIRVAQISAISASIADGEITADKLAEGFLDSLDDFDLDGAGSAYQVLGWDDDSVNSFGAYSLTHDWITDFDAAVEAKTLDEFGVPATNLDFNGKRATNAADPTSDQDLATKAYVDSSAASSGVDIDTTTTEVTLTREVARSNSGSTALFVTVVVVIQVNGVDTLYFQIKPTGSGSWETVQTVTLSFNGSGGTFGNRANCSFFVPVGYDYRYTSVYGALVTATEQQFA